LGELQANYMRTGASSRLGYMPLLVFHDHAPLMVVQGMYLGSAAEGTVRLLEHHGLIERAQFTSMDDRALAVAREHHAQLCRGLIVLGPPEDTDLQLAKDLGCTWLNADHEYLDQAKVQKMAQKGFRVGAWTVNDPARAVTLADWGVESIITDTRDVLAALAPRAEARPRF
jgi:glycerophosphoryl diester phosphodiesterase